MSDLSRLKYEIDSSRYIGDPMIRIISEHSKSYATDILITLDTIKQNSPGVFFWHLRESGDQCVLFSDLISGWYGEHLRGNIRDIERDASKHQFWIIVTTRRSTDGSGAAHIYGSLTSVSLYALRMLLELDPRGDQ